MSNKIKRVIRKVLNAASNTPNFFDFSDAQRLNWMIAQAFILGQHSAVHSVRRRQRREQAAPGEDAS